MPIKNYFPTLIYRESLRFSPRFIKDLGQECRLFRDLDDVGQRWSKKNYIQGYTSYSSITDLPFRSSSFDQLRRRLDRHVVRFARALDFDLKGGRLQMSSCWINVMGPACHHSFHLHPLSAISGTVYLELPLGSGCLKLEDPRLPAFMASPPRRDSCSERNQRFVNLLPRVGDVILFESWVKHEVPANHGKGERVSVSFNYDWS